MDEVLVKRLVGVIAFLLAALLLTSILPAPGQHASTSENERVVTMDLTQPDSVPVEQIPDGVGEPAGPVTTTQGPAESAATGVAPPGPAATTVAGEPRAPVAITELPEPVGPPSSATSSAPSATQAQPFAPLPTPVPAQTPVQPRAATSVAPAAKSSPRPAPVTRAPAKPASATASAKPPAKTGSGKWQVQAGAYAQLDRAERVRATANAAGVRCLLSPADTAKGTLYRVRCGPFDSRGAADAALKALVRSGIKGQIVDAGH